MPLLQAAANPGTASWADNQDVSAGSLATDDNAAGSTNAITATTGDAGAGNSGSISLGTGTATGTRGSVLLDGQTISLDAAAGIVVPDTGIAGNARGLNSFDLQPYRTVATQVASGTGSFLLGSTESTASGANSGVIGSTASTNEAARGVIVGGNNLSMGTGSADSVIIGGDNNHIIGATTPSCVIVGGDDNNIYAGAHRSGMLSSVRCDLTNAAYYSTIVGTYRGLIDGSYYATMLGAYRSTITSSNYSSIVGSRSTVTNSVYAVVVGGRSTINNSDYSVVVGGKSSNLDASNRSVLLGGSYGKSTAPNSVVLGGYSGLADLKSVVVFSGNNAAIDAERGKSQGQLVHLDGETIGAVADNLTTSGSELAITANGLFEVTGRVIAWNETDEKGSKWDIDVLVYNTGAALVIVAQLPVAGAQVAVSTDDGAHTLTVAAVGTTLRFTGTGVVAAKTLRWSAALMIARAVT